MIVIMSTFLIHQINLAFKPLVGSGLLLFKKFDISNFAKCTKKRHFYCKMTISFLPLLVSFSSCYFPFTKITKFQIISTFLRDILKEISTKTKKINRFKEGRFGWFWAQYRMSCFLPLYHSAELDAHIRNEIVTLPNKRSSDSSGGAGSHHVSRYLVGKTG